MGSGISSCSPGEIKCPKNYDKEKFQKILMLYDKLDTNGNMVMEQEEFYVLANHHIKNKKEFIRAFRKATNKKHSFFVINYSNDFKGRYLDSSFNPIDID